MPKQAQPYIFKKRGNIWYVRYAGEKFFVSTGHTNKTKAENQVQSQTTPQKHLISFREFSKKYFTNDCPWFERQKKRGKELQDNYRKEHYSKLHNHLLPRFGASYLRNMNAREIENWIYDLDYASSTQIHILNTLKIILLDAKREELINFDPGMIQRPILRNEEKTILENSEAEILFPHDLDDFSKFWGEATHTGVLLAILYSCGLRTGEARALKWSAVDYDRKGLKVIATINKDNNRSNPKAQSSRIVLLPSRTIRYLSFLNKDTEYLFSGQANEFIERATPSRALRRIIAKHDLNLNITPHGLRHSYNTRMRELLRDSPLKGMESQADELLREFTGHKSKKMTDHYDHPDLTKLLDFYNKYYRDVVESFW